MKPFPFTRVALGLILSVLLGSGPVWAQDSLADRINKLEQELAELKKLLTAQQQQQEQQQAEQLATRKDQEQLQLLAEEANAKKPKVDMGKDGIKVTSAVGNYSLRIGGYLQVDKRWFLDDDDSIGIDTFLVRRARPIIEGTAGDFGFRIMPDFAGSSTSLFDAYVEYRPTARFNMRAGKFKSPVSYDRRRSATDLTFAERSLPTLLAPNRDVGLMAFGTPRPGFSWELGVFNGAENLGSSISDEDSNKEFAGRLFAHPFGQSDSVLKGLGIGVAGSWGEKEGNLLNRQLGDYRSPAQERVFRYRFATFANGTHWRIAPQGYFYHGPFGVQAEYTVSSQEVTNGAARATLENSAWEVQLSYVLTGGVAGDRGWPVPANPFNPWNGDWGAWEIAARYGQLDVDDDAFPVFADPATSIRSADNYGFAVHAYLNESARLTLDYQASPFEGGAPAGEDRETEHVIFTRVNYKF